MKFIYLAIGGAIGTVSRFLLFSFISDQTGPTAFPWGTFSVNLIGSFLIGLIGGISTHYNFNYETRLFIFAGLLGGFTTFSALTYEGLNLFRTGNYSVALSYLILSNVIGVLLAAAGFISGKNIAI